MGKWSLLLVLGFALTLLVVVPSVHRHASDAYENDMKYLTSTRAHSIAVSAANMACNAVFLNPAWMAGYTDVPFSGGTYNVGVEHVGLAQVRVTAIGRFEADAETVKVLLQPSSYAKFAYYSKVEGGIYWITGDTVFGPLHTQAKMNISGEPVFLGKVTTRLGTNPKKSSAHFLGGYQSGVDLDLPADLNPLVAAANSGGRVFSSGDLWIKFNNGTVEWKTSLTGTVTSTLLSAFAPNGVILAAQGNIHVQGTIQGQATLCALGSSGLGFGNIYVDDDVRYSVDPRTGTSTDMLGLVCENNVIITDNAANNSDCVLQASVFCRTGGLTAEHYNTRPISGYLHLLGGIIQYQRGAVGQFTGTNTLLHGFLKDYRYDERFYVSAPPFFPKTGQFEIISWLE